MNSFEKYQQTKTITFSYYEIHLLKESIMLNVRSRGYGWDEIDDFLWGIYCKLEDEPWEKGE